MATPNTGVHGGRPSLSAQIKELSACWARCPQATDRRRPETVLTTHHWHLPLTVRPSCVWPWLSKRSMMMLALAIETF